MITPLEKLVNDKYEIFYKKELNERLLNEKIDVTADGDYVSVGQKIAMISKNKKLLLRANIEKEFKKDEIREFKRMYCYLARVESHNSNQNYMHHRLAEFIWRRERSFEDIYSDLKNNIIS